MKTLDLFNTVYERALNEGAVDDLEARRIHHLNTRMLELMSRATEPEYKANPAARASLMKQYAQVKDERDSYYKVNTNEGAMKRWLESQALRMSKDRFVSNAGEYGMSDQEAEEFWHNINGVEEAGIPGNVPVEKIPGKEDLLKGKGRSYYEDQKKNSETGPLDQKLQRLKVQARRQFPLAHTDDEALILKLLDKETQDDQANRRTDARQDAELRKNFALDREQDDDIDNLQTQVSVKEHGGGIGPKQHWQDLMQERKLSAGDPVVVTAPNEFEGKTGEIHELSPSGKFVIVDLYNHGKHSMHLSDVEYNQYADEQEEDDWYDEGMAEGRAQDATQKETGSVAETAAWRRKEGKSKSGGLNAKGVASYRRENPGSKLQTAVTTKPSKLKKGSKAAKRRKSFCARMGGVKGPMKKPNGKPTRKALALRKWNCEGMEHLDAQLASLLSEGWSDAMVSRRTGTPRTAYSVYIKGKKWKDFENDDHAEAVANKLRAKFKAEGKDPSVITIAPTDMSEAISKKDLVGRLQKDLPKVTDPKNKDANPVNWTGPGKDDYGYTGYQGHGMPTDKAEQARIRADKKKGVAEGKADYNFDADDLKRLERIRDLPTLKTQALALISRPSAKPMKPEKVEWFKNALDRMNSPIKVIKLMYDLLLSGEGHAVVGSKSSMNPNSYRQRFGEQDVAEAIVASGPSKPLDDRAVRKMVWDTMKINANTGEQALQRALAVLAKKPQSRMVQDLQDKFQNLADRLAQGMAETVTDTRAGMAEIYRRLAPKIERYRDSFLAGQLYDELENYAELHGAEREFKQMMNGARNRAHMEYDTNPGGFHNWFWFLPFADEELSEEQDTSGVERAILNRIMVAHTDLLLKFGPDKVMQAAEEVAYNVGDVDEIGTSDVSAYVAQVKQILGAVNETQVNEKWSAKYKSSINCASPKGFSQKAHCAGKKK